MTWPRPWRYKLDARPPWTGDQAAPERVTATPGPSFRHCRDCDVQWWGGTACWCCGKPVTDN